MDPNNPVIQLCIEGMQAEAQGRSADARALFERAWEARQDDYDACVAAHYLARHQDTPEEVLRWNREALDRAGAVGGEQVRGFYPSLHLNLGWSYESLGDQQCAREHYNLAATLLEHLPPGPYRDVVAGGIQAGLARLHSDP